VSIPSGAFPYLHTWHDFDSDTIALGRLVREFYAHASLG